MKKIEKLEEQNHNWTDAELWLIASSSYTNEELSDIIGVSEDSIMKRRARFIDSDLYKTVQKKRKRPYHHWTKAEEQMVMLVHENQEKFLAKAFGVTLGALRKKKRMLLMK